MRVGGRAAARIYRYRRRYWAARKRQQRTG